MIYSIIMFFKIILAVQVFFANNPVSSDKSMTLKFISSIKM